MVEVRTRDEAIAETSQALDKWHVTVTGALTQAHTVATNALAVADRAVMETGNRVAALEGMLTAADDARRPRLQAELVLANEKLALARRANLRVRDVLAGVERLRRAHGANTSIVVERARARLAQLGGAIDGYRAVRLGLGSSVGIAAPGGVGAGRPSAGPRGGTGSLSALGLSAVDVAAADLDENPILDDGGAEGGFGRGGLTRADYRWAVQTWSDVVGPGVDRGLTREDFAARDARSGAQPLRRTADVYDLFLGEERIRVDRRPDGSLNIVNGRHRLLIARELGIKTLPARVT